MAHTRAQLDGPCVMLVAAATHRKQTKGEIMAVMPAGHVWGTGERSPKYVVVRSSRSLGASLKYLHHMKRDTPVGPESDGPRYSVTPEDVDLALGLGKGSLDLTSRTGAEFESRLVDRAG